MWYLHTEMLQNKRYCCTDCDYIAKRSRDLKRHMQCHTGERSFMCAHCSYGAREKYHLKQHIMTHTKEAIHSRNNRYYCRQCGRIFTKDYLYKVCFNNNFVLFLIFPIFVTNCCNLTIFSNLS